MRFQGAAIKGSIVVPRKLTIAALAASAVTQAHAFMISLICLDPNVYCQSAAA